MYHFIRHTLHVSNSMPRQSGCCLNLYVKKIIMDKSYYLWVVKIGIIFISLHSSAFFNWPNINNLCIYLNACMHTYIPIHQYVYLDPQTWFYGASGYRTVLYPAFRNIMCHYPYKRSILRSLEILSGLSGIIQAGSNGEGTRTKMFLAYIVFCTFPVKINITGGSVEPPFL